MFLTSYDSIIKTAILFLLYSSNHHCSNRAALSRKNLTVQGKSRNAASALKSYSFAFCTNNLNRDIFTTLQQLNIYGILPAVSLRIYRLGRTIDFKTEGAKRHLQIFNLQSSIFNSGLQEGP